MGLLGWPSLTMMPSSSMLYRSSPRHPCSRLGRMSSIGSLHGLCNAKILHLSASPVYTPSTSKTWLTVSSQGGRSPGIFFSLCGPKHRSLVLAAFSNLSSSCAGGLLLWLSAFSGPDQAFDETLHGYLAELFGSSSNSWEVSFC